MMAGNTREYQIHDRNLYKTQRSTVRSRQKKKTVVTCHSICSQQNGTLILDELFANNVVFDREFVLHDAYQFKNPDFIYQRYGPFDLDDRDPPESKAELRVEAKGVLLWGDLDQDQ